MNSLIAAELMPTFVVEVSGDAKTRVVQVKSCGLFIVLETLLKCVCLLPVAKPGLHGPINRLPATV